MISVYDKHLSARIVLNKRTLTDKNHLHPVKTERPKNINLKKGSVNCEKSIGSAPLFL